MIAETEGTEVLRALCPVNSSLATAVRSLAHAAHAGFCQRRSGRDERHAVASWWGGMVVQWGVRQGGQVEGDCPCCVLQARWFSSDACCEVTDCSGQIHAVFAVHAGSKLCAAEPVQNPAALFYCFPAARRPGPAGL